jgi:phycobilisome rod-core linker protein
MPIPLLSYPPSSQNQRVANYEVPGDEQPRIFTTENLPSPGEKEQIVFAAYRQIFNEQLKVCKASSIVYLTVKSI